VVALLVVALLVVALLVVALLPGPTATGSNGYPIPLLLAEELLLVVALLLKPRGWLGWLHLPVAVFVWLYSWAWGDLPVFVVHGEVVSATEECEVV